LQGTLHQRHFPPNQTMHAWAIVSIRLLCIAKCIVLCQCSMYPKVCWISSSAPPHMKMFSPFAPYLQAHVEQSYRRMRIQYLYKISLELVLSWCLQRWLCLPMPSSSKSKSFLKNPRWGWGRRLFHLPTGGNCIRRPDWFIHDPRNKHTLLRCYVVLP
jgi:hypothetical protein